MIITRVSELTGRFLTLDIDITPDELRLFMGGVPLRDLCPHLDPSLTWYLFYGITPEEHNEVYHGNKDPF